VSEPIAGKLSERVPEEFRELLDEIEPWLESQPARNWQDYVVYATDAAPEFALGAVDQRFHCIIVPKAAAIADEEGYDTDAGRELAAIFRKEQKSDRAWVVLSSASNNIHVMECRVVTLHVGGEA